MSSSHQRRPRLQGVVHVTQKICPNLPSLRTRGTFRVLAETVRAGNEKRGFRVCEFSVLSNHFHFLVEVSDNRALARGMQGLAIRIAKALNRYWGRRGRVFLERYFARALKTMRAIRRALVYVLQNARKHGVRLARGRPDPFSSSAWFRFWRERPQLRRDASPVVAARHPTLDQILMQRIGLSEIPGRLRAAT